MPYAVKKPHPTHANVKVWHSWDPDGDGYEEIRKFPTQAAADAWVAEFHPTKNCEVVEVGYEIMQDDQTILEAYNNSISTDTSAGLMSLSNRDSCTETGPCRNFTVNAEIED